MTSFSFVLSQYESQNGILTWNVILRMEAYAWRDIYILSLCESEDKQDEIII